MAGLEDKDYLLRQYSQMAKALASMLGKDGAQQLVHFEITQSETKKLPAKNGK